MLFIEPITCDGYTYSPPGGLGNQGLTRERVALALGSLGNRCAKCESKPQYLWMPLKDVDEKAMEKQPRLNYWSIPSEPAKWQETMALCQEHLLIQLGAYFEIFFLTFRFPSEGDGGYYS
jgi:hypothetical protein